MGVRAVSKVASLILHPHASLTALCTLVLWLLQLSYSTLLRSTVICVVCAWHAITQMYVGSNYLVCQLAFMGPLQASTRRSPELNLYFQSGSTRGNRRPLARTVRSVL